ncbi:Putative beta-lactamase-inhibitor-like, PepSY-like [Salinimicrobium sediminis]|uniref:Beta-lactamase-inhibitor-like, PepSY-like n=1 Tax=Salinimicrobium sediminis TaxID=1343891 RepID=A0A285X568_9FLAO|nr:PepSY-like domain-containing protein [Salinimicrobium sediminis]SOC79924.1 Putative beta-lactamase-inhibitor-like, PepSY-like [Salinimicrobium sediminis]
MKKIKFLSLAFVALLSLNSCSSDDDGDTGTDVDLNLIADSSDHHVNSAALPQPVLTYISTNYPDNTIHEAEVEDNGQFEVELNNGIELVFDAQGNFLGIDDDGEDDFGDEDIAAANLPEKIRNFISTHFAGASIEEAELENNGNYEIELSTDVKLVFNANGDFLGRVDDDDNDDKDDEDIAVADLPQSIRDYIAENYPDNSIIEAEKEDDGTFEVTLNNGMELKFDAEGNFVSVDDHNGDDDDDDDDNGED